VKKRHFLAEKASQSGTSATSTRRYTLEAGCLEAHNNIVLTGCTGLLAPRSTPLVTLEGSGLEMQNLWCHHRNTRVLRHFFGSRLLEPVGNRGQDSGSSTLVALCHSFWIAPVQTWRQTGSRVQVSGPVDRGPSLLFRTRLLPACIGDSISRVHDCWFRARAKTC
jgi:hypothetical protein